MDAITHDNIVFSMFLIFTGAAVLATAALYARQSLLVAYMVLGVLFGPWVLALVSDVRLIENISHVGIIFLLFLLGLNLHPQRLLKMLGKATLVTLASCAIFGAAGLGVALGFGFGARDGLVVGSAVMFSSTIIGLKLLPATVLHHQQGGRLIISVLLLQDLIAIVVLLLLQGLAVGRNPVLDILWSVLSLPGLILFAFLCERYVLIKLVRRFDKIHEYMFLAAIGWCLGLAQLASVIGLSQEVGAFIAGVSLATSPISLFIAESLRPLRDFFLIIFFFSLGAGFDLSVLPQVLAPALALGAAVLLIKPWVFQALLRSAGESETLSREIGVRLGQGSEFSLLIAYLAVELGFISEHISYVIQLATLLTFIASSYLIVLRYPTPIAVSDRLRRD